MSNETKPKKKPGEHYAVKSPGRGGARAGSGRPKGSTNKITLEDLLQHIADYYVISLGEAEDYVYILRKEGIEHILEKSGMNEKEMKKLLKDVL